MMEWQKLQQALQRGGEDADHAAKDLDFARELAAAAVRAETAWNTRGKRLRAPLTRLRNAISAQPDESREHLEMLGRSYNRLVDLDDLYLVVNEAIDLIGMDGRKPLPIRGAVQWLLIHYHGQGNQITNTLYGPDDVPDRPSACVSWLTAELKNLRPETHEGEVYDVLRSPKLRTFIADLQKLPSGWD